MRDALEARVYDGLLLLGRQGQYAEHDADDAGSPAAVAIEVEQAPLGAYRPGDGATVAYARAAAPLEATVESEPLDAPSERDFGLCIEAAHHFLLSTPTAPATAAAPTAPPTPGRSQRQTSPRSTPRAARRSPSSPSACPTRWRLTAESSGALGPSRRVRATSGSPRCRGRNARRADGWPAPRWVGSGRQGREHHPLAMASPRS